MKSDRWKRRGGFLLNLASLLRAVRRGDPAWSREDAPFAGNADEARVREALLEWIRLQPPDPLL
jgi:hypothetical protein